MWQGEREEDEGGKQGGTIAQEPWQHGRKFSQQQEALFESTSGYIAEDCTRLGCVLATGSKGVRTTGSKKLGGLRGRSKEMRERWADTEGQCDFRQGDLELSREEGVSSIPGPDNTVRIRASQPQLLVAAAVRISLFMGCMKLLVGTSRVSNETLTDTAIPSACHQGYNQTSCL